MRSVRRRVAGQAGAGALGCVLVILICAFVVAINVAFIAGAIFAGWKAYVAFEAGRMVAAFLWAVLCGFFGLGVIGSTLGGSRRA